MKLVDVFWYSKRDGPTEEELRQQKEKKKEEMIAAAKAAAAEARAQREEATKLKDMKTILYGEYMTKVPIIDQNRYLDVPLHTSAAKPSKRKNVGPLDDASQPKRIAGQRLVGSMVPKLKTHISDALTKLEEKPGRSSRLSLGIAAALVLFASIWYGAPLLSQRLTLHSLRLPKWERNMAVEIGNSTLTELAPGINVKMESVRRSGMLITEVT
mmetsp:Transcript_16744/g.48155  ORF Transcript_16744/g.48155 Transcript_16744/m.48155 type:complete len:213 (+) Transcript_16744:2615-3253(+)